MAGYNPGFGLNYNNYQTFPITNPYVQQNPTPVPQYNLQNTYFIPGRVVGDLSEITTNEVPMDGRVSLFPKNDYSCIYAKTWESNGTISTVKFVPESDADDQKIIEAKVVDGSSNEILDRLDLICDKLERLAKRNNYQKSYKNQDYNRSGQQNQNGSKNHEE